MSPARNGRAEVPAGRRFLDELDARRVAIASDMQRVLGTGPEAVPATSEPLRTVLRSEGASLRLVIGLAGLAAATALPLALFVALLPSISDGLGASRAALSALDVASAGIVVVAALGLARLATRRSPVRLAVLVAGGAALATVAAGFVTTAGGLFLALAVASVGAAAVRVLHPVVLVDGAPPAVRARVLAVHRAADTSGFVVACVVAATLRSAGLTWRGAYVMSGAAALAVVVLVAAMRIRRPPGGAFDAARVRDLVRDPDDARGDETGEELGFMERARGALHLPTVRRVLGLWAALGALTIPLLGFVLFFLAGRWHVGAAGRLGVLAVALGFTVPVLALVAPRIDTAFAEDPGRPLKIAAVAAVAAAAGLVTAVVLPAFVLAALGVALTLAAVSVIVVALDLVGLSVTPSPARPAVAALAQVSYLLVGGLGGVLVFGGVDRRFGLGGALVSLILPAALLARLAWRAAATVARDLDRLGRDVVIAGELARYAHRGEAVPLLVCRGIDFSYGALQVLFGVDFTVDDGQLVALLGTNGAGKSTLLRVISGLGLPERGTVHLRGEDVTFLDAERRLGLGIAQVPGGRAVFGPLTVAENLRVVGAAAGRDRRTIDSRIDDVFAAFPRLAERRNQSAVTLSGGEQQMLGLSKALLLRPRVLLIDELSLGLAPKILGELLAMVRRINQDGTAVVLVEQSVNVALSLADHAYFLEKGEVRFDGPAAQLLDRRDLVRSVFLGGATRRLSGATSGGRR